ncbi:glutamic acid-rich protein precursor, putative [Entamoeba nuttalli P19]|uniref:Glutamic acid-rich protein, putative n=1 Tax=Entamoeba nuttalli (strain P19) TaxID=1076696 RepID=K2I057_ENTNP|nr:glutamic acid-rich protein precursor, putative [Entamoeba nuttalli P19]EKE42115.1 glutamic acid-rich protein precursor, putative [Entamoeba nuttalli P19]|eukprot:XP_008855549.1 glutamic acid-rich protein precursor, putative [Entamoeba nuttalli P19]
MKEATHMTPQSVIEIKQGNLKEEDKKENNITEEDKNKIKEEEKQEELIENISNYYGEESKIKNYIRANEIEKRRKEVELGKEIEEEIAMIIGGISDDVKQIEVISREIIDKCKKDKDKREGIIMKIIESMLRNEIVVTTNPNRVHVYGEIIGNICFEWKEYRDQIITKIRSISPVFNSIYPKRTDKIEYEMIMKYKTKESDEKYFNRIRHSFKILTGILMSEVGDQTILLDIVMNGMYMQYDNKEVCLGRVGDLIGSMVEIMLDECGDKLKHTEYMPRVIQTIKEYLPIAQSHWEGKGPQGDYVMRKIKVLLQRYEKNLPFNKKVVDYQKELADYKKQIGLESCVWENTTKIKVVDTNEIHSKDNITTQENEEEHKDNITTERIEEESNKNTKNKKRRRKKKTKKIQKTKKKIIKTMLIQKRIMKKRRTKKKKREKYLKMIQKLKLIFILNQSLN